MIEIRNYGHARRPVAERCMGIRPVQTDPAAPTKVQPRTVEVQVEPGAGNVNSGGTFAIEGQLVVPPGARGPSIPRAPWRFLRPASALGHPGNGRLLPSVRHRRVLGMPGPFNRPGGDNRVWIASATATLAGKAEKLAIPRRRHDPCLGHAPLAVETQGGAGR